MTASKQTDTIKLYRSLCNQILQREEASVGRVWYLLRYLDQAGRGWLSIEDVREALTAKGSAIRVFGWRRLRQILAQGEGVYWHRECRQEGHRIWLFGLGKMAQEIGVTHLSGAPTEIPVTHLLGGIQEVRAHFYALTHSRKRPAPIARITIRGLTGSAERTQQTYDKVSKTRSEKNLILLRIDSESDYQESLYKYGRNQFCFTDYNGSQPFSESELIARRLPNTYHAPDTHRRGSRSRQRKINRRLNALVDTQAQGNGQKRIEKRYYQSEKQAVQDARRNGIGEAVYWESSVSVYPARSGSGKTDTGHGCVFWVDGGMASLQLRHKSVTSKQLSSDSAELSSNDIQVAIGKQALTTIDGTQIPLQIKIVLPMSGSLMAKQV